MANLKISLHFLHKKDCEMNSFLVKNCPVGIIFSSAFSSIQMDVADTNR